MGISPFNSCSVNSEAQAPNPRNWELLEKIEFPYAHLLRVRYPGCTNFEGEKILIYKGRYIKREVLDPHFTEGDDSPIARFKPNEEGFLAAIDLASRFT